jgi:hypothetical protein
MTELAERTTRGGSVHAPALAEDLVDLYEVEAHGFLTSEAENVAKLVGALRDAIGRGEPRAKIEELLGTLEAVVRSWARVARPIQLSARSRGRDHDPSWELARNVRSLAMEIFRRAEQLEDPVRMTRLLGDIFSDVPRVADVVWRDFQQLDEIKQKQEGLRYEVELGSVFASRLSISHQGIEWHGTRWPFDAIDRVRWGAVFRRVNGVPSGTEYTIAFGNARCDSWVKTARADVFEAVTSRLAEAVGVRIIVEMLGALGRGEKLRFGNAVIDDLGVELPVRKLFVNAPPIHVPWSGITLSSGDGFFRLIKRGTDNVGVALSYQDEWNIHPLEMALRRFFKTTEERFSSLLEEKGRAA